jgi:hypothetical protein
VAPNPRCLTPENVEFIAMHTRGVAILPFVRGF